MTERLYDGTSLAVDDLGACGNRLVGPQHVDQPHIHLAAS